MIIDDKKSYDYKYKYTITGRALFTYNLTCCFFAKRKNKYDSLFAIELIIYSIPICQATSAHYRCYILLIITFDEIVMLKNFHYGYLKK